jgi:hypothetical protein
MKLFFFTLIILISICSCEHTNNNLKKSREVVDDFYTSTGSFGDYIRAPLIKPYELTKTHSGNDWKIKLYTYTIDLTINNVREVNVIKDVIIIYSGETYFRDLKKPQAWFIIIPAKQIEIGFDTKELFLSYLSKLDVKNEKFYDADEVYKKFHKNNKLDWEKDFPSPLSGASISLKK